MKMNNPLLFQLTCSTVHIQMMIHITAYSHDCGVKLSVWSEWMNLPPFLQNCSQVAPIGSLIVLFQLFHNSFCWRCMVTDSAVYKSESRRPTCWYVSRHQCQLRPREDFKRITGAGGRELSWASSMMERKLGKLEEKKEWSCGSFKRTMCNDGKNHIPLGTDSVCSAATGDVSDH